MGIPLLSHRSLFCRISIDLLTSTFFPGLDQCVSAECGKRGHKLVLSVVCRTSGFQVATALEPKGVLSIIPPYLGIRQEAIMAPWGDHLARPGPQTPATLLLKLCPGRQLPSPPTACSMSDKHPVANAYRISRP